jgi:hypothetical protein
MKGRVGLLETLVSPEAVSDRQGTSCSRCGLVHTYSLNTVKHTRSNPLCKVKFITIHLS